MQLKALYTIKTVRGWTPDENWRAQMKVYRIDTDAKTIEERTEKENICFAIDVDGASIYTCNHPTGRIHEVEIDEDLNVATQDDLDRAYCSAHDLDELAEDCQFGGGGLPFERAEDRRTQKVLVEAGFQAVRYEDGVEREITETIMTLVPCKVQATLVACEENDLQVKRIVSLLTKNAVKSSTKKVNIADLKVLCTR